ncbi:BadF/BadG/BcrA/BcrD ATPase family protein [Deinococcus sedimenti]|uniref:ATPase BadF/BadG/BcrA/BcrD type domain-containing protein n=1 Tax=Deinococcus sedimenti TaxID=1867090 RepID=A0ABQ2S4T9_9DEIO|nr:BadF/BadG/BcrA/BcrD ATPase family protein [Deinococcus sedimenti]GGR92280.1 hypothetical protein GCM10008960_18920 [Deinococcus sedimenti]
MTPLRLGLDLGGSRSKWHLLRGETTLAHGFAPPLTAALLGTPGGQASLAALTGALPARPDWVHAGLPGFGPGRPDAADLHARLAAALGLHPERVRLESDLVLAYRAHFRPGEGVLVYAGTGSLACHLAADGTLLRAGGHGYHIDDDGAGYALGRAALRWVTGQLDQGRDPQGPLAEEVRGVAGGLDWDTLRHLAYHAPGAAAVATLAPAVGRAADRGDAAAQAMLRDAAHALAALARTVQARLPAPRPTVVSGGALRVSARFESALALALPGMSVAFRDHAVAAARLAGPSVVFPTAGQPDLDHDEQ